MATMFYSHDSAAPALDVETSISAGALQRLFDHIELAWNQLGREAPHWSVLSSDAFKPAAMAENADAERQFFASGTRDLERILASLRRNRLDPAQIKKVCEFGCGLGRVSAHLAGQFELIYALDISESHLSYARQRFTSDNIKWRKTTVGSLGPPEPVDLWFSRIVLQHNPPPIIMAILKTAFASLRKGGVAMFQVPTYCTGYSFGVERYLSAPPPPGIEMHILPQQNIHALGREMGLNLLEVITDDDGIEGWTSQRFLFQRPQS